MLEILAQATQPAQQWVWSNIHWDDLIAQLYKAAEFFGILFSLLSAGVVALVVFWYGLRKKVNDLKSQVDQNSAGVRFLAQASPASSTLVTPEIKAAVNDLATGAPPKT